MKRARASCVAVIRLDRLSRNIEDAERILATITEGASPVCHPERLWKTLPSDNPALGSEATEAGLRSQRDNSSVAGHRH